MIRDIGVWCCAAIMIKRYGDTADIEAAKRADEYGALGERDGQRVWLRISQAIDDLRTVKPGEAKRGSVWMRIARAIDELRKAEPDVTRN